MEVRTARTLSDAHARNIHPRMDYTSEEGRRYAIRIKPYLEPLVRPRMRALDLGCSFGKSAFLLCELGANVTGIDISLGALHFAASLGRTIQAQIVFAMADYTKLPFCAGTFEMALFTHNVVECSPNEFAILISETNRVLSAGGLFVVSVADKWAKDEQSTPELKTSSITIPGEGTFPYPVYSWSSKAVREAAMPIFGSVDLIRMPERGGTWMVFRK